MTLLACRKCNEALVLDEFFGGGEFGFATNRVKITGVDIKQEDIDTAIKRHQRPDYTEPITTYNLPENYQFIQGDATNVDKYPQVPKQADVVMIRHQQVSDNKEVWGKIFKQRLSRVRPAGIMLITSFSDIEHHRMLEELLRLDCNVVLNEKTLGQSKQASQKSQ